MICLTLRFFLSVEPFLSNNTRLSLTRNVEAKVTPRNLHSSTLNLGSCNS